MGVDGVAVAPSEDAGYDLQSKVLLMHFRSLARRNACTSLCLGNLNDLKIRL